jgi:50S ribosomal subunit-associated GTPase HflX
VQISALQRLGFDELLNALDRATRGDVVSLDLVVPYGQESVLAELRQLGGVESAEYAREGTHAHGWVPEHAAHRFARYRAADSARST